MRLSTHPLVRSATLVALAGMSLTTAACAPADHGLDIAASHDHVTDEPAGEIEQQSINNSWLYAAASWAESMHYAATGEVFDISQSYWTYWHWYDEIERSSSDTLWTGGDNTLSNALIRSRGLMREIDFVSEDASSNTSARQRTALAAINQELSTGRLGSLMARSDARLVRDVLDEAWQLRPEVVAQLDLAFGENGKRRLGNGASTAGTKVIAGGDFAARYTDASSGEVIVKDADLNQAGSDWRHAFYPHGDAARRELQIRVQRALDDGQVVMATWAVDFNALESEDPDLLGSFNLATLAAAGEPGNQGGHTAVFKDYEVETEQFGVLAAGVALDPADPADGAKLAAAQLPSSRLRFFRIDNTWGGLFDARAGAPGFPTYHDLHMDYLDGPIDWFCFGTKTVCNTTFTPWVDVILPPGY